MENVSVSPALSAVVQTLNVESRYFCDAASVGFDDPQMLVRVGNVRYVECRTSITSDAVPTDPDGHSAMMDD